MDSGTVTADCNTPGHYMWTGSICVIWKVTGSMCLFPDYMCWKYSQDASAAPQQLKAGGLGERVGICMSRTE